MHRYLLCKKIDFEAFFLRVLFYFEGILNILITGGTGSLGVALFKHFTANPVKRLICYSRDWHKQDKLKTELSGDTSFIRYFIGDVRDKERLHRALNGIDTVIHAAAHKDIVSAEYDSFEAIKTNVIGTQNVIEASIDNNVSKVLVISTDKAVNALNCYGRTKALAESLSVASNSYARYSKTKISVCRYGNVFGSSGSVVPLFLEQAKTNQLTITDQLMTRFFISMDSAVLFILNCLKEMQGGEIFIPKLKSALINDVAKAIAPEANVTITGLRPSEKLHETLITTEEIKRTYDNGDYYTIVPELPFWEVKPKGVKVVGQSYCSNTNSNWFSVEELRDMIPREKVCNCK